MTVSAGVSTDPLTKILSEHHGAVEDYLTRARAVSAGRWAAPVAPGKWSPGQITEHLAIASEFSCELLHGTVTVRGAPRPLRPIIRVLGLGYVLRSGRFPRGSKAPPQFQPSAAPAAAPVLCLRLQQATERVEAEMRNAGAAGRRTLEHPYFGRVLLHRYVALQALHVRHHLAQLPNAE